MTNTEAIAGADRAFFDALISADSQQLEGLLAPDFLIVDVASGAVTHRADFLQFVGSGQVVFNEIESFPDEAVVRQFDRTVVVVGRTRLTFTLPDGVNVRTGSRYTHVFVPTMDGRWQLASAQGTALHET